MKDAHVGHVGANVVTPDLFGAVKFILGDVEEGLGVRPYSITAGGGDWGCELLTGGQIADVDSELDEKRGGEGDG